MRKFWSEWFISASSGLFGRILILIVGVGAVYIGSKYITLPTDSVVIKEFIDLMRTIVFAIYGILLFKLPDILGWLSEKGKDRITEKELENENLKLENKNLKLELELQQQKKQSTLDNDEEE